MCVIVYKPKNAPMPGLDTLQKCFDANPHGVGFAWNDNAIVYVVKGVTKFETIEQIYDKLLLNLEPYDTVLHFRFASAGAINAKMTHPFQISDDTQELSYSETKKTVIFHNGTVSGLGNNRESDTYILAKWLYQLKKRGLKNTDLASILEMLTGNRFILLSPRRVYVIGKGWHKHQECYYSNMSWKITFKHHGHRLGYHPGQPFEYRWDINDHNHYF